MTTDSKAVQGDWAEQIARAAMGRHAVDVVALDEVARQLRAAEHRGYTMGHKAGDDFRSAALASTAGAGAGDDIEAAKRLTAGCLVSIDVSTGDEDAGNRVFGIITGVQHGGPGGRTFLAEYESRNFEAPAVSASPRSGAGEKVDQALLRELSDLADWLERDSSENDADNVRAAVSALSQGGGAGRSEKGEGEEGHEFFGDQVVIWSERQRRYWKAIGEGVTKDLRCAAVHRRSDAEKIADGAPWLRLIPLAEAAAREAPAQSPSTSDAEG